MVSSDFKKKGEKREKENKENASSDIPL
jgi:hypothetical protein